MKKSQNKHTVVIAAGGTGGHIFPAQALAEKLSNNNITPVLICDDRADQFLQGIFLNIQKFYIHSEKMTGSFDKKVWGIVKLLFSILKVRSYLKKINPQMVIGFGGYPSFPTLFAAKSLNIKVIVHEQNAVLGRVNRWLAPLVDEICLSFPHTINLKPRYKTKTHIIGNPIREDILKTLLKSKESKKPSKGINLLVIGGSQGAKIMTDVVPFALKELPEKLQPQITVYQQARDNLIDKTEDNYQGFLGKVTIKPFFTNIASLLQSSDLVICRSGASSIAELMVAKKPSILIPLAIATDNHQFYNAKFLTDQGQGILLLEKEFTIAALASQLEKLLMDKANIERISSKFAHKNSHNASSDFVKFIKQKLAS